jgi:hypothetical protein
MNRDTIEETPKQSLVEFEKQLGLYTNELSKIKSPQDLKHSITNTFIQLANSFILLSDYTCTSCDQAQETYLINYKLSEDYKNLIILHRDVFLELNKVSIYIKEKQVSDQDSVNHFKSSFTELDNATKEFVNIVTQEKQKLKKDSKSNQKSKRLLSFHQNPWELYKTQYLTLMNQFSLIQDNNKKLLETVEIFNRLKQITIDANNDYKLVVGEVKSTISYLKEHIKDAISLSTLSSYIDDKIKSNLFSESSYNVFVENLNKQIDELTHFSIYIAPQDGLLVIREIDFNKKTQKWFDYQILPDFMDLVTLDTNLKNKYQSNLINLKNRIQLAKSDANNENLNFIIRSFTLFLDEISTIEVKSNHIIEQINTKVKTQLLASNLLKGMPFLEVTLNSSLSIEGNTLINNIKAFLKNKNLYLSSRYKASTNHKFKTDFELGTQCIAHRMLKSEKGYYDSLFLSKQFVGDLFLISRKSQESKLEETVNIWRNGNNKSALITGERLSGRSTFLEYNSKKLFGKDVVVLNPENHAVIGGRKFRTTRNLKEALQYVKNNNLNANEPCVVIDDLELWRDSDHGLIDNVRALIDFIESESDTVFVMVSITNKMLNHLDNRLNFSNVFSNIIDVSIAEKHEIMEALLLRHGAAHRELMSENNEPISNHMVQKIASNLCKKNNYNNIGETLQSWTYNIFVGENEEIMLKESNHEFLDFFTLQEKIILKQALIFKTISEINLKQVTALAYESNFKSALRRLINTKVLLRETKGDLFINPMVVNDVSRIINKKNI